jgi:hypothetical protein
VRVRSGALSPEGHTSLLLSSSKKLKLNNEREMRTTEAEKFPTGRIRAV